MVHHPDFKVLLAANAIGALGTALISPVLHSLTTPFGVSASRIGLLVTAIAAPSIFLIPASGLLTDRFGRKPILVVGLLLFGGGGVGIAFTTDFRVALGLRMVQGVGFAGVIPVIITCIGDLYVGDAESTAQGLRFAVSGLSQAVFPALAGLLVVLAWQYPFLLYGIAIPIAIVVYRRFEEPTSIRAPDGSTEGPDLNGGYLSSLVRLASHRRVSAILLARCVVVVPFIGFLTYNSLVVVGAIGGTPRDAGILVAIFSGIYAATATQAGRVTAVFDSRTYPLVAANACVGGGLALFAVAPSLPVAGVGILVLGAGVGLTFSLYRSIITGFAPELLRGGLVSVGESLGRVAATITPVVMGVVIAALEPTLGTAAAIRLTVGIVGGFGGIAGVSFVLLAHVSPARPNEIR